MVRYRSIPKDLLTIVRVREDEAMEDPKLLILHNAISKYLECRRRIWNLPQLNNGNDRTTRATAEYILSVLMQRRLQEGFRVATWPLQGGRLTQSPTHSLYRNSSRAHQSSILGQLNAIKRLQAEYGEQLGRVSDNRPLALIAESWSEPCAVCESKVVQVGKPIVCDRVSLHHHNTRPTGV
ncbi:unnamed protein product [Nippostrongylus brasiliensis]|uniref:Protein SZT2 (inferred by orthology to a human protein) n=1 Tax=Nippostrongylus brasiliensis TaxID=27835 RepID=A0A0N4XDF9_NIPBR|nr:unnamed protein product [Nippostrongylus brasiliensis]